MNIPNVILRQYSHILHYINLRFFLLFFFLFFNALDLLGRFGLKQLLAVEIFNKFISGFAHDSDLEFLNYRTAKPRATDKYFPPHSIYGFHNISRRSDLRDRKRE